MKAVCRILTVVILLEAILAGWYVVQRAGRVRPPTVDMGRLDPLTRADLKEVVAAARDGGFREWRELGEAYLGNGYYVAAEQCFRHVIELDPRDQQAGYAQGFCLERIGRTTEAIEVLTRTATSASGELVQTCWYQIGRCLLREERAAEAEQAFLRISDFPPAAYQLAKLLIRSDRSAQAVPILERQLKVFPNSLKLLQLQMRAAEAEGDFALATALRDREDRAQYQLVLEYGQSFISMFASRYGLSARLSNAMRLKTEGTLQARRAALAKVLEVVLHNRLWQFRSVLVAAAHVELGLGNFEAARQLATQIENSTYGGVDLLELQSLLAAAAGDDDTAYQILLRACRLKPSVDLYDQLSRARGPLAEQDRARNRAMAVLMSGIDAWRANDVERAESLLEQAASELSKNQTAWFYLGEARRLRGDRDGAMAAYQKCLQLNPDHGRAIAAMNSLSDNKEKSRVGA
ncbi:MAG: tetratricopeptide repeat protein [Fuerstiella sp.]